MLSCLRFTRSGEKNALFQEAVKVVRDVSGVDVVWVGEDVEPDRGCVYVLESFDTPHYKALLDRCRIVGPGVILAHLKHGWPLPASTQPVFSFAMHGVVACFTQAGNKERREKLTQLVKLMGGKVEGDFTKRVTHLIAGHVGSTKYHVARKLRLPVLLPSWVESCWSDGLKEVVYATHSTILTPHKAPPFTGLTITVTGLDEKTRTKVKEMCLANGGNYSGELTKDVCTHLLVGSKASTKYKYARQWKMYCVTPQWFNDSVESGYCMPEGEYDVDCEGGGGVEKGREKAAYDWRKNIESFKLPTVSEDEFLDGCKIFLSGFKEEELMALYKIVNLGGGVRLGRLSESISHVVLGEQEQSVISEIQQLNSCPHVVSAQWLLDCCSKGERVEEESYLCVEPVYNRGSAAVGKKRKLAVENEATEDQSKRPRCHDYSDTEELDEEDLMNQYKGGGSPTEDMPTGNGVLSGKGVSVSKLFLADDRKIAIQVVKEHGGKVVSSPNGTYHLLPLEVSGMSVEKTGASHVTMIWLQQCIEADTLFDPSSYFLFTPMTTPIYMSTLSDCVLAFSQFSDIEREHLVRFSRGLGAVVQDHFARYPAHGLLATTHLILKHPSGDKYTFAHKWGIPALADSWLFACAEAQKIVPVDSHLISLLEPALPPSIPALPSSSAAPPTSMSENAQSTFKDIDTERRSPDHVPSEAEREQAEGESTKADSVEKPAILGGVVIAVSKKLGSQESQLRKLASELGAELRRRLDQKCTHFVYQGKATEALRDRDVKLAKEQDCYIVSPHWIAACSKQCARVEEADYPHTYNPNMALAGLSMPKNTLSQSQPRLPPTHFNTPHTRTSDGNETDPHDETDSDGTGSETENTNVQSSEAVKRLQEHLEQIKEAPMEQQKRRRSRRLLSKKDKSSNPPPASHLSHPHKSPTKKGQNRRDRRGRRKDEQILESQVTDSQLLQVTYDDGKKEREKLLARIQREEELKARGIDPKDVPPPDSEDVKTKSSRAENKQKSGKSQVTAPLRATRVDENINDRDLPPSTPAAPSLNVPIVTHTSKGGGDVQQLYDEKSSILRARKPTPPKILLSSLDQREKMDYGALIQELGGEYIDQDYFTSKCTHLVVGKASRTEKYLGACAAGKWVLHKSYLEECRASHSFVKEEPHEWGAIKPGGVVQPLEAAPRTWRLALAERQRQIPGNSGGGAFDGWKVLLFAERNKLPGLKRLLEAGGAQVLSTAGHKSATHAFISMSSFPKDSLSLEQLVSNGVHCLKPDYIAEYLSKGSAIQTETLYINEVKPLLQRKR